jgi:tRNA-binding EMAP/Myf-like protein
MDVRVGQIMSIEQHPDADSLYVEQVGPRGPQAAHPSSAVGGG